MSLTQPELDCTATVHAMIQRHPATRAVFQAHGVDICCGGGVSVEHSRLMARLLGEMEVPATTIKNNADKILDRMRATKDSLGRQVKTLDELMEDLRGA